MDAKPRELYLLFRGFKVTYWYAMPFPVWCFISSRWEHSMHVTLGWDLIWTSLLFSLFLLFTTSPRLHKIDWQTEQEALIIRDLSTDWSNRMTAMVITTFSLLMSLVVSSRATKEVFWKWRIKMAKTCHLLALSPSPVESMRRPPNKNSP